MRCWYCGVGPDAVFEITDFQDIEPRYLPNWPRAATDHEHAERPPSPAQLEQAGHEVLLQVRRQAHG